MNILRTGLLTKKNKEKELYKRNFQKSIVDYLPWVEYLDDSNSILLEDGRSVGAIFEIIPYGTEAKTFEKLKDIREVVNNAIQDSFSERDSNPWVVQFYCNDDNSLNDYIERLREYPKNNAKDTEYTQNWLDIMEIHLKGITKNNGLFFDNEVTKTIWRGQLRRTRMVIYRYVGDKETISTSRALEELNFACHSVIDSLKGAGISCIRLGKSAVHDWLCRWFNPNFAGMTKDEFLKTSKLIIEDEDIEGEDVPILNDFTESLFFSEPKSQNGFWYFDGLPHSVLVVDRLKKRPNIGHITGETPKADGINALFDLLPEGTVMVQTIVIFPQDKLENHILNISKKALGENSESISVKEDCSDVMGFLKSRHKMFKCAFAFYVVGSDERDLKRKLLNLNNILNNNGIVAVKDGCEVEPLKSYLRWLPMNFNPEYDKKSLYTKFQWCQHISNLAPLFGRSCGTGNSGVTFFNRGGGILTYDPLRDRAQNGHKLILGPTGAGKSATLVGEISQLIAMERPRTIIVETGNSFGLMVDYMEKFGVSVHRVSLKPGSGVVLNPLADSHLIFGNNNNLFNDEENLNDDILAEALYSSDSDEGEGDAQRDVLGEIEIAIRLMITGGELEEDKLLRRADRAMIRQAIIMAAKKALDEKRQAIPSDVQQALFQIGENVEIPQIRRNKAYEMGEAMGMFTQGFEGDIFNKQGQHWPDVDLIHVDLATFAREGYEAQLSIAYISLINHINNMGELYQHQSRAIVNITDEAHIITVNPLLAAYLTKASKMWRKLGVWLWLATQNMEDFPDAAAKLLSMIEWWEMLVTESSEAEKIKRFKSLTAEQVAMITSARKVKNKYTEGVVLSKKMEALFRIVPPSLFLALAMTEKDEKAERMEIMKTNNVSELDAAIEVARRLDVKRGLVNN